MSQGFPNTIHMTFTIIHVLETVAAFAISIAILVYAMGGNCSPTSCKSMIFITSTFFSSRQLESNYGWPVATERSQIGEVVIYPSDRDTYAFSHYFECMHTAQMADALCGAAETVPAYKACLYNSTDSALALTTCNALSGTNYVTHWPTPEEYTRCLFTHEVMRNSQSLRGSQNVFRSCISKTLWPFFESQQTVDSNLPLGSFNWSILIAAGLIVMTSFAVYTVSWFEDGHVVKGEPQIFMRFGVFWSAISLAWSIIFFIIFATVAFNHTTAFEYNGGVPTTASTMFLTMALLGFCILYYAGEVSQSQYWTFKEHPFKSGVDHVGRFTEKWKGHYNSARDKFAKITKQRGSHHDPKKSDSANATIVHTVNPEDPAGHGQACLRMPLQPATKELNIMSPEEVATYYTPPLMSTWADGYIADGCLFLGLAGATGQLTSDQSWNLFTLITLYRVLNMMIARFMYESFMNNLCYDETYNTGKFAIKNYPLRGRMEAGGLSFLPDNAEHRRGEYAHVPKDDGDEKHHKGQQHAISLDNIHLDIKVLGLSTQFASVYLFAAICYIVLNGNVALSEYGLFTGFFFVGFAIPETIRFVAHVVCQVRSPAPNQIPWLLLNTHFFVWIWDLAARIVVTSIVVLGTDAELEGTRQYLVKHANNLMGEYLRLLDVSA